MNKRLVEMDRVTETPRALIVASVPGHIRTFHTLHLEALAGSGWSVDAAASGVDDIPGAIKRFSVPFARNPLSASNLVAFKTMREILDRNRYDVIHVHTPTASVITRLAALRARKRGAKVIYTAHGFHFHKGSSPLSWVVYFPVEKLLARVTDLLLTINGEDYDCARRFFKANVRHVNGVGVDPSRFDHDDPDAVRRKTRFELGVGADDYVALCVGELNANKNRGVLLQAWSQLVRTHPSHRLLIVGDGPLAQELREQITLLGLSRNVLMLGRRSDVPELLRASDTLLAPSLREGLPVNVIEAMMSGCAVIASDNRGHRELIESGRSGVIVSSNRAQQWLEQIELLSSDAELRARLAKVAEAESERYAVQQVLPSVLRLYTRASSPVSPQSASPAHKDDS